MAGPGSGIDVLCVDDDEQLVTLVTRRLESVADDIGATALSDPMAALEHLGSDADVDCVVSDYDMPRMNGLDLLERVREDHPDLPFILYTGKGSEEIASEAIGAGVTDYLQKGRGTEHYELLANRIREYVDRHRTAREYELSRQRYRRLVEQSVVGIGLSQDGVFEYVNPRFADIFGYGPEELVGEAVEAVIADEDVDRVQEAIDQRESGDVDSVHYVVTAVDKDGEAFEVEVNGSRVVYEGDPAVLGVVQPLNTRRKALAETDAEVVAELQARLERALGHLQRADDGDAVDDARGALRGAIESLTSEPVPAVDGVGTVDLAAPCRKTLSETAAETSLTVESSPTVVAGSTAVEDLLAALWDAWTAAVGPISVTLDADGESFELAVEPAERGDGDPPADPPALSRTVEHLEWEVHVTDTDAGRRYSFREVDVV